MAKFPADPSDVRRVSTYKNVFLLESTEISYFHIFMSRLGTTSIRRFRKYTSGSSGARSLIGGSGAHFLAQSCSLAPTFKLQKIAVLRALMMRFCARAGAPSGSIFGCSDAPGLDFAASDANFLTLRGSAAPTFVSRALFYWYDHHC